MPLTLLSLGSIINIIVIRLGLCSVLSLGVVGSSCHHGEVGKKYILRIHIIKGQSLIVHTQFPKQPHSQARAQLSVNCSINKQEKSL